MHRFWAEGEYREGAVLPLTTEEAAHAGKVLRLRPGDAVELTDGKGERWRGELTQVDKVSALARLIERLPTNQSPVTLTVYQGYLKADKLEFLSQKLTELGASALCPVHMARSVAGSESKDNAKKRERLVRIAREAAKQCGRAIAPEMREAIPFALLAKEIGRHELALVPWEESREGRLSEIHAQLPEARDIALVIGPEGGIEAREMEMLIEAGAKGVTLGPRILRAETAALAAASAILCLWGDL